MTSGWLALASVVTLAVGLYIRWQRRQDIQQKIELLEKMRADFLDVEREWYSSRARPRQHGPHQGDAR